MNPEARLRASRLAWFGAGSGAAMLGLFRLYGWAVVATGDLQGPDFLSFYAAARLTLARGGAHLYEAALQKHFQEQVTAGWPGSFILLPYLHPPYYTLVILPLGLLPFHTAYLVLGAVNLGLLAGTVLVLARANRLGTAATAVTAAATVAYLPVFVVLVQGQSDMFILLPLSLSYLCWVRGRQGWAGVLAGLAIFKPQMVLLVPVLFLGRRAWPALAGYAAAAGALLLASLPVFGIQGWARYLGVVSPWVVSGGHDFPISGQTVYSLRGLLEGAPGGRPVAVALLAVAAVAAMLVLATTERRPGLDMAFAIAASVVLSPYQNLHDLSLLLIPGVALAAAARTGALPHRAAALGLVLAAYVAVELTPVLGPQVAALGALALALYLGWARLARRPPEGATGPQTS